jgi:hypothetical protein
MLVLPGQGVLTILLWFILMDLPGKYRFERWLVARPLVFKSINRLRHRAGGLRSFLRSNRGRPGRRQDGGA